MKKVITKIIVTSSASVEDLTEENINRYKKDIYQMIKNEADTDAEIQVIVEIEN